MKIKKHTRRARLLAGGKLSNGIVKKLLKLQRGMCAACHCKLSKSGQHIDHIMPIAKGGANIDGNVQLLCPSCNLDKNAKHPIDWAQENGRLL
jgi:5-methylcytosine-specific restriction endonuclease McrA